MKKILLFTALSLLFSGAVANAESRTWDFSGGSGNISLSNIAFLGSDCGVYVSGSAAWSFNTYGYGVDGSVCLKSPSMAPTGPTNQQMPVFPVKAGTLSMKVKTASPYASSFKLMIFKSDTPSQAPAGMVTSMLSSTPVHEQTYYKSDGYIDTEFKEISIPIDFDGYIAIAANQIYLDDLTNTWGGTTVVSKYPVSGKVVDNSGSPIQGVSVLISGYPAATTDAQGAYTIADVAEGSYSISATKLGYKNGTGSVTVSGGAATAANIVMEQDYSSLKVRLANYDDFSWVSGATVKLYEGSDDSTEPVATATTDASGYAIVGVYGVLGSAYTLKCEAKYFSTLTKPVKVNGYGLSLNQGQQNETSQYLDVKKVKLNVNVKDSKTSDPIVGATVKLLNSTEGEKTLTATSTAGLYELKNINAMTAAEKDYTVSVSVPGYKDATLPAFKFSGEDRTFDASVEMLTAILSGTVTDKLDNKAIEGVTLSFVAAGDDSATPLTATTNADGNYEIVVNGQLAEKYNLSAEAEYYTSFTKDGITLNNDNPVIVDIALDPIMYDFNAVVNGSNANGETAPLANATVAATDPDGATVDVTNDGNGNFSFSARASVAAKGDYTVNVSCEGYEAAEPFKFSFDGENIMKTFTLNEIVYSFTAVVNGKNADGETTPLANATVTATDPAGAAITVTNDGNGRYSFTATALEAAKGDYTVNVSCEGYVDAEPYVFSFDGENLEVAITLDAEEQGGIVTLNADSDGDIVVYDLNGNAYRVNDLKALVPGIYIIKKAGKVYKVAL